MEAQRDTALNHFVTDPELRDALKQSGVRSAQDLLDLAQPNDSHNVGTRIQLDVEGTNGRFYLKAYRYPDWRKSKGLIGRGSLWGKAPCVREFQNLAWLRSRRVRVPRPVAAASIARRGRLAAHALLTEWVDDAPNLVMRIEDDRDPLRADEASWAAVLRDVGATAGLLHRIGFLHGDLFARNVLVHEHPWIYVLDCRRGRRRAGERAMTKEYRGLRADLQGRIPDRLLAVMDEAYPRARARV